MAHFRLGHTDQARQCLAEAARWIDEANHQTKDDINGTGSVWGRWYEQCLYPLLFQEAQDLVKGPGPATRQAAPRPAGTAGNPPA